MSDESPGGVRKAINPCTWLVCAQIVKIGRSEEEPTEDSMFSAAHEPTEGSAFGTGRRARARTRQCFRRGARAHPNRPLGSARRECADRISVGGRYRYLQWAWGLSTHGVEACQPAAVVLRRSLWQAGQNIGVAVGADFAVLECAVERGDELKLPLESCTVGPLFANALPCLVDGG